jgi:hypothetical protein
MAHERAAVGVGRVRGSAGGLAALACLLVCATASGGPLPGVEGSAAGAASAPVPAAVATVATADPRGAPRDEARDRPLAAVVLVLLGMAVIAGIRRGYT